MKTYLVRVAETWSVIADYEVEAEDPQDAIECYKAGEGWARLQEVTGCDPDPSPDVDDVVEIVVVRP